MIQLKAAPRRLDYKGTIMRPFVFRCPTTGMNVQAFSAEERRPSERVQRYEMTECLACRGFHLVDPETGVLMPDRR